MYKMNAVKTLATYSDKYFKNCFLYFVIVLNLLSTVGTTGILNNNFLCGITRRYLVGI